MQKQEEEQRDNQMLYAWGSAEFDQFYISEDQFDCRKPVEIPYFITNNITIHKIACGTQHSLLLSTQGVVYSLGSNDVGALGREGVENTPAPVEISMKMDMISAGDSHSCAANGANGVVYSWGVYKNIVSGNMSKANRIPVQTGETSFHRRQIQKLLSGANHTLVLSDKKVFAWGDSETCVLGRMPTAKRRFEQSLKVGGLRYRNVLDLFTAGNHCFLVTETKSRKDKSTHKHLYAWGLNNWGQLGVGAGDNTFIAREVETMRDREIADIVGGEYHTLMLLKNGEVYGCGKNVFFELGALNREELIKHEIISPEDPEDKSPDSVWYPTKIDLPLPCKKIFANAYYSYAVQEDNAIKTWGLGSSYVLANGKDDEIKGPWTISQEKFLKCNVGTMSLGHNFVMFTSAQNYWEEGKMDPSVSLQINKPKSRRATRKNSKMAEEDMPEDPVQAILAEPLGGQAVRDDLKRSSPTVERSSQDSKRSPIKKALPLPQIVEKENTEEKQ